MQKAIFCTFLVKCRARDVKVKFHCKLKVGKTTIFFTFRTPNFHYVSFFEIYNFLVLVFKNVSCVLFKNEERKRLSQFLKVKVNKFYGVRNAISNCKNEDKE